MTALFSFLFTPFPFSVAQEEISNVETQREMAPPFVKKREQESGHTESAFHHSKLIIGAACMLLLGWKWQC